MPRCLALLLLAVLATGCGSESTDQARTTSETPQASPPEAPPFERVGVPGLPWAQLSAAQIEEAARMGVPPAFENAWGMRFVYVPHGAFSMGSPEGEHGRQAGEALHEVRLRAGYFLQIGPVTIEQWQRRPDGPAQDVYGGSMAYPAGHMSHEEALQFATWLSGQDETFDYRLPTEAEWEYACRAGSQSAYASGSAYATLPEGNAWGLRKMHVGSREWSLDRFGELATWTVQDPIGPNEGKDFVVRGGGSAAAPARSAFRAAVAGSERAVDLGLRLLVPIGYGLGKYGSIDVTFRLEDRMAAAGAAAPSGGYDLRIIRMNDRLTARTALVDAVWARVVAPPSPVTLTMVPGKYYVYTEARRGEDMVRGLEIKFQVWDRPVEVPVPIPEKDMRRYGSGGQEKPQ